MAVFPPKINVYLADAFFVTPLDSFEDIAADSGFASSSQFAKKFKEITGTTPRAWLSIHS